MKKRRKNSVEKNEEKKKKGGKQKKGRKKKKKENNNSPYAAFDFWNFVLQGDRHWVPLQVEAAPGEELATY